MNTPSGSVLSMQSSESIDEDKIPYEDLTEVQKIQRDEDKIPYEKLTEPQKEQRQIKEEQRQIKEKQRRVKEIKRKAKKQTGSRPVST